MLGEQDGGRREIEGTETGRIFSKVITMFSKLTGVLATQICKYLFKKKVIDLNILKVCAFD